MIYYFIANLTELEPEKEILLLDNLTLKTVPPELLLELKSLIKRYYPENRSTLFNILINDFYNSFHEYKKVKDLPSGSIHIVPRKHDDFRYFVLQDNDKKFKQIYSKAFALSDKDFFIPFSFVFNTNTAIKTSFNHLCIYTYYNDLNTNDKYLLNKKVRIKAPNNFTDFDKVQIVEYIKLIEKFEKIESDFPYICKALNDFFHTFELSDYSVFKIVSYIACLELLLVDGNPDRLKSISSQLQVKLNLLNNQFESPIDINDYIKGPDTLTLGKVIETIYTYRSLVAHGDFIDFSKKLNILEKIDSEDILNFIRVVLKKVIIYSLKNPTLIRDLKKC